MRAKIAPCFSAETRGWVRAPTQRGEKRTQNFRGPTASAGLKIRHRRMLAGMAWRRPFAPGAACNLVGLDAGANMPGDVVPGIEGRQKGSGPESGPARRLAAVLAADIVGYSKLMGIDEEGTHARVKRHRRELIDPTISEHHGRLIQNTGDGFIAMFDSPVEAVRCAIVIH